MKNFTITPVIPMTWQLTLSASACATPAFPVLVAPTTQLVGNAAVATDVKAVKRERALTGTGHRGFNAVHVSGFHAWSPPI